MTRREKCLAILEQLRLIDDDFFSEALNGKNEAVQFILRTILERDDITVISAKSQVEYKSALKRSVKLDVQAVDTEGRVMDIEIQRTNSGSGERRARFYSSMIDRELLEKGDAFDSLADTYVIFICENDKFGKGMPLYHIDRCIKELEYEPFHDGAHIVYVNGSYRNTAHPVGALMHDFFCKRAADMLSPVLAEEVRYRKESEGGRSQMCKLLEDYGKEERDEGREEERREAEKKAYDTSLDTARSLLAENVFSLEKVAQFSHLPLETVERLAAEMGVNAPE